jgi:hypothetical protein
MVTAKIADIFGMLRAAKLLAKTVVKLRLPPIFAANVVSQQFASYCGSLLWFPAYLRHGKVLFPGINA